MKIIKLNIPALYSKIPSDDMDIKVMPIAYPYLNEKGIILKSTSDVSVYRYAKPYEVNNVKFSIIMISTSNDTKSIDKFMTTVAESITESSAKDINNKSNMDFNYLNYTYKENE